ncbi:MAG: AAA family ATPase, partial [Dysgonamonadaceae bacterium]|nr:AAA family ATPase [Dysgonamonadaceae bacterium]
MITPDKNNRFFQLAEDFINQTSEHLFLTGKAGTGKTTFLKHISKYTHKKTIVTAPTGVAAVNAGGTTLHSLFQLPLEPYIPGASQTFKKNLFRFSKQKLEMLRQLELLIIDEVSMLRADTLDAIDDFLRYIRRNQYQPFGGVQVLYIGDMFQLPPVAQKDEWELLKTHYQSTFFFHAKVIEKTKPVYVELKKVYRQKDASFVNLLNRIRNNNTTPEDFQTLNERYNPYFNPPETENYIILTTHNYKADNINNRKLAELPAQEHLFSGETHGDFPDYSLPTDKQLRLKKGAQVMFLKNDTEEPRRYYNGKIATISRIDSDQIYVYIADTNTEILIKRETWENKRYYLDKESGEIKEELLGSFSQYPIRLAWAITIHKSQGLTFEKAIIDTGNSFAAGQTYVALSRCISLDGIVLFSKIHPNSILTDNYALEFSRSEKAEQELDKIFQAGKRKFWAE